MAAPWMDIMTNTSGSIGGNVGNIASLIGQAQIRKDLKKDKAAADANLLELQNKGAEDTLSPEVRNAYAMALAKYKDRQAAAKFGFSDAETNNFTGNVERSLTRDNILAKESGGGQMSKYFGAISGNKKTGSLLEWAAKDAMFKLAKQNQADAQFGDVSNLSGQIQGQKNFDTVNFRNDLLRAGGAVSDLRTMLLENKQAMWQTGSRLAKGFTSSQGYKSQGGESGNNFSQMYQNSGNNRLNGGDSSLYQQGSVDAGTGSYNEFGTQIA